MKVGSLEALYWWVRGDLEAEPMLSRTEMPISLQAPEYDHQLSKPDHNSWNLRITSCRRDLASKYGA